MAAAAPTPDNPVSRLQHARSLHCTYTDEATIAFNPLPTIVANNDLMVVVYDNIDLQHGTARVIYEKGVSPGASDVSVRWNGNAVWFTEVPKSTPTTSNAIMTTVFAKYAPGTEDFIALDSRHSLSFVVTGSTASGTCTTMH